MPRKQTINDVPESSIQESPSLNLKERNDLIEEYRPMAHNIAKKFIKFGFRFQDLITIAEDALMVAASKYDPTRGSFKPYAYSYVNKTLKHYTLSINKKKNRTVSGNAQRFDDGSETLFDSMKDEKSPDAEILNTQADLKTKLHEAIKTLTKEQRAILDMLLNKEMSLKEISETLGISPKKASAKKNEIVETLREEMGIAA